MRESPAQNMAMRQWRRCRLTAVSFSIGAWVVGPSSNRNRMIAACSVPTRIGHARLSKQQKIAVIRSSPQLTGYPNSAFLLLCHYSVRTRNSTMRFFNDSCWASIFCCSLREGCSDCCNRTHSNRKACAVSTMPLSADGIAATFPHRTANSVRFLCSSFSALGTGHAPNA